MYSTYFPVSALLPIDKMSSADCHDSHRRLKVLMVAAAVHPDKGSEPGLGWGWIVALSKYHDLWIITGEREGNREAIERELLQQPELRSRLKFFFIPRPDGPWLERIWPPYYYRLYRLWHLEALRVAQKLTSEISFDLAHQLNMTGFREPGFLWTLELPFVWGPVGGTVNVPLRFARMLGAREFLYHLVKVTINNLQLRYHPRVRSALQRADAFITSNSDTQEAFRRVHKKGSIVIQDTGPISEKLIQSLDSSKEENSIFRISWSGLHISRKALPILLHALAKIQYRVQFHLDIIGDGPMFSRWKKMAKSLGLQDRLTWHGWLAKPKALAIIAQSDLFAFPSLHEGTPTVVMEALSLGVPVLCLDHCGQADVVNSECGIKIPVTDLDSVIKSFAEAILFLDKNEEILQKLSVGAIKRIREFSWESKAFKMNKFYQAIVEKTYNDVFVNG